MLWHSERGSEGIDGAGGVGKDREFRDFERLADGIYIV